LTARHPYVFPILPALLAAALILANPAGAGHSVVHLHEEGGFAQNISLEAGAVYEVQMQVRTDAGGEVVLRIESLGEDGSVKEFRQTERGLLPDGQWQVLSVQIPVPEGAAENRMKLMAPEPGAYQWKDLQIRRIRADEDEVRRSWTEKFQTYSHVYTGLVVDARHLEADRSMSPRILSESGQLIYGGVFASMDYVQEEGVVSYGRELEPPLTDRVAADPHYPLVLPLIVEAVDVNDPAGTHLVIRDSDAERIFSALAAHDFLSRHAVVILID